MDKRVYTRGLRERACICCALASDFCLFRHIGCFIVVIVKRARARTQRSDLFDFRYIVRPDCLYYVFVNTVYFSLTLLLPIYIAFHFQLWIFSFYCVHTQQNNNNKKKTTSIWVLPFGIHILFLISSLTVGASMHFRILTGSHLEPIVYTERWTGWWEDRGTNTNQ